LTSQLILRQGDQREQPAKRIGANVCFTGAAKKINLAEVTGIQVAVIKLALTQRGVP